MRDNLDLADLWSITHNQLRRANVDRKHPFRLMVLTTHGSPYPNSRWVVNRGFVDPADFHMYTDSRSPKIDQIVKDHHGQLLFYDSRKRLQIRVKGELYIVKEGELYDQHYNRIIQRPDDYTTIDTPGVPVEVSYLRGGEIHFALLVFKAISWDILLLGETHHRVKVVKSNEEWRWYPVVP